MKAFLIVLFFNHGAGFPVQVVTEYPDMSSCYRAIRHAEFQTSNGDAVGVTSAMFCAYEPTSLKSVRGE